VREKLVPTILATALVAACGGSQEPPSQKQLDKEVKETMRRAQTGEKVVQTDSGLNPCDILGAVDVARMFGVDPAAIEFRPSFTSHPLCHASWRRENADELEELQKKQMREGVQRKVAAMQKREAFDEKMPKPIDAYASVNLTIVNQEFDSPAKAAAFLENSVATLEKGITVEVMGKKHTTQVDYDDWMSGVGDRAAWAPKMSQLSVAAKGVVYHVGVDLDDDAAENQRRAIELARKVAAAL